jgi:site-specific DNA-methyltransferase (cytosine-N4-specific)
MNNELPFGTQFSPKVVNLQTILKLIKDNEGQETNVLLNALVNAFYSEVAVSSQRAMANNCRTSLVAYGLLNSGGGVYMSEFGNTLLNISQDNQLHDMFAKHILSNLNGLVLIDCIRDLNRAGTNVTNETIIVALGKRGFNYARTANNPQVMKLWLERAGVLSKWRVDERKLNELIDISESELTLLRTLSKEQYFFVKALCNIGSRDFQRAADVRKLATAIYGIDIKEKSFAANVLNPLVGKGIVELQRATGGRGAKSHDIKLTELTLKEVIIPLLEQIESVIGNEFLQYYQKTLPEIRRDIDSTNVHEKGLALEAFAIKVMDIIGLTFVETRLKGNQTAGAEVDVLFESNNLLYSRWQVQCKNSPRVSIDHVAKEVGLHHVLKTNAIVIMTTGTASDAARRYANEIMRSTNICIIFIEGNDIDTIVNSPTTIIDVFNREALAAKQIKVFNTDVEIEE